MSLNVFPVANRKYVDQLVRRWAAARVGLRVWDFPRWNATLDDALETLPETDGCPHDVLRILAEPRGSTPKRTLLVLEGSEPVAVIPLRLLGAMWQPVTTWIIPGRPFPTDGTDLLHILHAISLPLNLAWWRCPGPPPTSRRVVLSALEPTYRLPCSDDAESYWRSTRLLKEIRRARRQCADFEVRRDAADGTQLITRAWATKWRIGDDTVEDRLAALGYLETRGRHHNLTVYDGDRPIAGGTWIEHNGDASGGAIFRDPGYDRCNLGKYVLSSIVEQVRSLGLRGVDFGGTQEYKRRWAPVGGYKCSIRVFPPFYGATSRIGKVWRAMTRIASGLS